MTAIRASSAYHLTDYPTYNTPIRDGETVLNYGDTPLWSGTGPPPRMNTRVLVKMNALGYGTVKGYFIEAGWLGVYVALENPPDWWIKQNKHVPPGRDRWSMLFGIEIAANTP